MEIDGEIWAFLVGDTFVCFHCYNPVRDKEDAILTRGQFTDRDDWLCVRCRKKVRPDRRLVNRRAARDRPYRAAAVSSPDRYADTDRRCRLERRTPRRTMPTLAENRRALWARLADRTRPPESRTLVRNR